MEWLSPEFFSALLAIVMIDLVLAGDNAIVIGMAARNLPKEKQRSVIIWGTAGAVVIRAIATLIVVWLLQIPGLLLIGGLLLIWIAYKLFTEQKGHEQIEAKSTTIAAIRTIIVADAVMGLDNVLAVAGAAHGSFLLVVLGLLISVPIMIWGSTLVLRWMERFPWIVYIGAGVLAWTAARMISHEPMLEGYFMEIPALQWILAAVVIIGVLLAGRMKKQQTVRTT